MRSRSDVGDAEVGAVTGLVAVEECQANFLPHVTIIMSESRNLAPSWKPMVAHKSLSSLAFRKIGLTVTIQPGSRG